MRRMIEVPCDGETLAATLDTAPGTTGLLIVSGGNEIRSGAHRGMAMLAQRLAARGVPVLRYDRRGVGDSSGINSGFLSARPDLIAAAAAFRAAMPAVSRLVGFGNCDAASTLALFGHDAGVDAVVLANPWLAGETDDLPPAAAIRARYAERLRDPREWLRLTRGGVNFVSIINGLRKVSTSSDKRKSAPVLDAIGGWGSDATIVLATGDATALAYAATARRIGLICRTVDIPTASHSFAGIVEAAALEDAIATVLQSPSRRT